MKMRETQNTKSESFFTKIFNKNFSEYCQKCGKVFVSQKDDTNPFCGTCRKVQAQHAAEQTRRQVELDRWNNLTPEQQNLLLFQAATTPATTTKKYGGFVAVGNDIPTMIATGVATGALSYWLLNRK